MNVVNPNLASMSATNAAIVSTGGAFTLVLFDLRSMAGPDGKIIDAQYELGRVRLTPLAFMALEESISKAKGFHENIWGKLPTPETINKGYGDGNAAQNEWHVPPPIVPPGENPA